MSLDALALRDLERKHLSVLRRMTDGDKLDLVRVQVEQLFDEIADILGRVICGMEGRI